MTVNPLLAHTPHHILLCGIFRWAPPRYEPLCVCLSECPKTCAFLCPPLCVSVCPPVRFCVPPSLCVSVFLPYALLCPPLTFLSKILRFPEISFKGISLIKLTQEATLS